MLVDSHIHSHYSSDCRLSPNKIAQTLRNLGLCGVLTDHYDFDHTQGSFFTFDVFEFLEDPIVKGIDNLGRGIEMGLVPQLRSIHEKHVALGEFDFFLGSLHYAYRDDELFEFTRSHGMDIVAYYKEYWLSMIDAVEDNGFIHALAHVDYPSRYIREFEGEIPLDDVEHLIRKTFKLLAQKNVSLEINTRRFAQEKAKAQWRWFLKVFKECGGESVTFGSDAHTLETIGSHFRTAQEMAAEARLTPVYYKNAKRCEMTE